MKQNSSHKKQRASYHSSNSVSRSVNRTLGQLALGERMRSIVAHSLGPALTCGLHGDDPDKLTYLSRTMVAFRDDNIFATAVTEWPRNEDDGKGQTKLDLTRKLALLIEEKHSQTGFHAAAEVHAHYSPRKEDIRRMARFRAVTEEEGRLDILLSEGTSESKDLTTPLAVIKVGRHTDEWWTKLDQIVKYIDIISEHEQEDPRLQFQEPLLCVVMTIDGEEETPEHLQTRFGVFLCWRTTGYQQFRMAPLWYALNCTLKEVSEAFGQFLQVTASFAKWRKEKDKTYQYLSSHCCRVGEYVVSVVCPAIQGLCTTPLLTARSLLRTCIGTGASEF